MGGPVGSDASTFVRQRIDAITAARPVGSAPADAVIDRALELYERGGLTPQRLRPAIARLESKLRADIPDLVIHRPPKSASQSPSRAVLLVCEPRVIDMGRRMLVSAESHAVVLTTTAVHATRGVLPGWASPHLFERIDQRLGRAESLTATLLALSCLWPTLLVMRARQRLKGVGVPPSAIVTPFAGGLLFGAIEKVEGMPPQGMTATIVDGIARRTRSLRDWYADDRGNRLFVETKTFVAADRLSLSQLELHGRLKAFTDEFADVVAEADWRWRIGYGQRDEAVDAIASAFRIRPVGDGRREEAYDLLEQLVESDLWLDEVARNAANQNRKRRPGIVRKGR